MKRKTKAQMVLEIYDREAMGEVTPHEIAIINRGLIEEFGEGGVLAPAEIASILIDEDLPVRFDQVFNMSAPDERYEQLFASVVDISNLASAEASIRRIHSLHSEMSRLGDRRGAEYARAVARNAKETARLASANSRLDQRLRREQGEIVEWLTIWLQTPDLFENWLEVRKSTADFHANFT